MASTISFGDSNYGIQARTINGPVSAAFYLPPERLETPPPPSIVIPFARDSDFVERGTTLDRVDEICAAPGGRAVLVGLGGVGKSQLAIEYAYRTRERSPETWVFWVHASNAARFEQSFRDIADQAKIAGRRDLQANIFKLVYDWLCDCKQRWLLVLDNVDDARFLLDVRADISGQAAKATGGGGRPLREYLPYVRGSILVTTRSKEAALKLAEQHNMFNVEPMDKREGLALFKKKLGVQEDSSDVAKLAAALEHMPLAIVQAAAYISQRAPRYSVKRYLDEFEKSERKRTGLLNYDEAHLRRDWEANNSIIITWEISFAYIQQTRPSAADLLSLMSFFDRQGIPEGLLRRGETADYAQAVQKGEEGDDTDSDSESSIWQLGADANEFEEDVATLRNFYFISTDPEGTTFKMHALVQLAIRRWLIANNRLEPWKQQFVTNLWAAFPTGEYENWAACQTLYAHAKSALQQRPEHESSIAEWATVLYRAAWFAGEIGNIADAKVLATKAMKARKQVLGQDHEDTLMSIAMAGLAYRLDGQWDDAERLEVQVIETNRTLRGADHPDTLMSIANLALTYRQQGRWNDAEKLLVQVIKTSSMKPEVDRLFTLSCMANLASILRDQGRRDDAEKLLVQLIETSKSKLGSDHPNTLHSMANLASIYRNQGRWDDAERLEVQVMETHKTKLGVDHPFTLNSIASLALTYGAQGRWDDAEKLQVQVVETRKTRLRMDHPDMLTSIANLASIYEKQGRLKNAEKLFLEVIETSKTKLGTDHPHTLTSMANLASTYRNQGRWDNAEELEMQVIKTRMTRLGADHPDTLNSMANLAAIYKKQGHLKDAERLLVQVIETSKLKLGPDHPDILTGLTNLASIYCKQRRWDDAEVLLVQTMETSKTKLGADHFFTLSSINNLSLMYKHQRRWGDAEVLDKQLMETTKTKLKADHPSTLISMANLASTYWKQGRWDDTEVLLVQVTETSKMKFGADHPSTLTSMNNLACAWKAQGRTADAIALMRQCLQQRQRVLEASHPDIQSSLAALEQWEAE